MGFYLIYPKENQFNKKEIFNLELGLDNVVLIISGNFSTKNKNKKYAFSYTSNYFITEPKLIDENKLKKYIDYVSIFAEENPDFTIGTDLIFLAIPENEYLDQMYDNQNTLIILDKVSQTIKNKFKTYNWKIIDDY